MSLKERIICKLYNLLKVPVNRALILLDRVRGLDFNRSVICRINGCYYYECTHLCTHGMLRKTGEEATGRDALLDVGCGKGRMLWFFSRCPFGRVDGIEHNPRIADIAERNLQKLRVRSRVFRMDARDFTRWQDYNWFYFYNPFPDRVMDICLRHMIDSLTSHPRRLNVIYVNPECHELLLRRGFTEVPVEYSLWEKLWFPNLRYIRRYRYDL